MPWLRYPLPHTVGIMLEDSEEEKLRLVEGYLGAERKLGENLLNGVEEEVGAAVRSRVIVGNPGDEDVEGFSEQNGPVLEASAPKVVKCGNLWKSLAEDVVAEGLRPGWVVEEPAFSIETAAEVVEAIAVAAIGSG